MNKQLAILSTALFVAACGGSNSPAQDPSSPSTTSASVDNTAMYPAMSNPTPAPAASIQTSSPTMAAIPTTQTSQPKDDSNKNAAMSGSMSGNGSPTAAATVGVNQNPGVADGTKNADNTKINDRDRHGALTPMDQGGSEAERNITASIRKGVVGDKSLSFTAKNVKIITNGTKVTLRGAVKTDQERSAIELRAKQTAGVTDVDNQIEVKK